MKRSLPCRLHTEPGDTIEVITERMDQFMSKGMAFYCPCCGQLVKLYSRPIRAGMVIALAHIYHYQMKHPDEWCHVEKVLAEARPQVRGGDWCKLRFWGMLEKRPADPNDNNGNPRRGFWRVTDKGISFLCGKVNVEERAMVFNNKCHGLRGDVVSAIECLRKGGFSYAEIMG